MKLIESNYKIIEQEPGLEGILKAIEIAARTCYRSESFIKEGSAKRMVDALIQRGHGTPLEHGTVYLKISHTSPLADPNYFKSMDDIMFYKRNPYSEAVDLTEDHFHHDVYITTNYRVLVENDRLGDLKYLSDQTEHHKRRYMVKIICSRAVSLEWVRHRIGMSYCQESQRYCNYTLDKFDNSVLFVIPEWVKNKINDAAEEKDPFTNQRKDYLVNMPIEHVIVKYMTCEDRAVNCWVQALQRDEEDYLYLINSEELKPQEARGILPNDCKTEIVITGSEDAWKHFFKLRTAKDAHPDIRAIACPLEAEFKLRGYIC